MSRAPVLAAGAVILFAGGCAGWLGLYGGSLINRNLMAPPTEGDRIARFDTLAPTWDQEVGAVEDKHGISALRERLLQNVPPGARVLETAAGTGRNIKLYPSDASVVLTDVSTGMLTELRAAVERFAAESARRPTASEALPLPPPPRFVVQAMDAHTVPYPRHSFDCVVDTFGLCSFTHPSKTLDELFRVLRPGGSLLLLEHGQGAWAPVRWYQRATAPQHLHDYGCFYNRPIRYLVESSKFVVEEVDSCHAGTTVYLRATRPESVEDRFPETPRRRSWWTLW
jgi:methyltransferase OMS1